MISIYIDGAYSSSRDIGGWAFVVLEDGVKIDSNFFPVPNTTNNRMEVHEITELTILSDSMYVIGTMTLNWKRKKNTDLWEIMDTVTKNLTINWKHVKGHEGNKYNELCDALAVQATFVI